MPKGTEHMLGLRNVLAGVRDMGSLLIKRGTVMAPLVPLLYLAVAFVLLAYPFRSVALVRGVPLFSALLVIAALGIVFSYLRQYASFAKHDPDRLQSEEYRLQTMKQMIAAKGLRHPMPAESLPLADPTENPAERQSRADGRETPELPSAEEDRKP